MTSRQLEEIYERMHKPVPPEIRTPSANKFNARKKLADGILFDSTGEAQAYQILKLQEKAGVISNLELQPEYVLQDKFRDAATGRMHRAIIYRADFRFVRDGCAIVIDFKGFRGLAVFSIKHKMFRSKHPEIAFEIWTRDTLKLLR